MRFSLLSILCLLFLSPLSAQAKHAENHILPPPVASDDSSGHASDSALNTDESALNLNDEFKAPDADSNVDVRSYERKDGATITEYSLNGQIYRIKVQPVGGLPAYYLYRNKTGGFERRRPGGQPAVTPPSWILKKF